MPRFYVTIDDHEFVTHADTVEEAVSDAASYFDLSPGDEVFVSEMSEPVLHKVQPLKPSGGPLVEPDDPKYVQARDWFLQMVESTPLDEIGVEIQDFLASGGNLTSLALVARNYRDDPRVRPVLEDISAAMLG